MALRVAATPRKSPRWVPWLDLERSHDVAVDGLPMNLGSEVGKRLAQPVVEQPHSGFVGGGAGLGRVVDEVVGEQFLEQGEIAVALHLFGVAANHRLGGYGLAARGRRHLGGVWVGHWLSALSVDIDREYAED